MARSLPEPVEPEPVPAPEVQPDTAYPEIPAVPEAAPTNVDDVNVGPADGALVMHGVNGDIVHQLSSDVNGDIPAQADLVLAAEAPRTRTEVHAEYVPEDGDDSPPPPAEDTYTSKARADFADDLAAGRTPTIRTLRDTYSIGQVRAQRIQRELGTA